MNVQFNAFLHISGPVQPRHRSRPQHSIKHSLGPLTGHRTLLHIPTPLSPLQGNTSEPCHGGTPLFLAFFTSFARPISQISMHILKITLFRYDCQTINKGLKMCHFMNCKIHVPHKIITLIKKGNIPSPPKTTAVSLHVHSLQVATTPSVIAID